ncbi:transporter substrate-binding domain-containing protein [Colwellia sp. Arc7-635]|jgi:polar amino acid transport system substrate-binding protein|uniref:substrate-binding periplasmic protein n=1 Tax=Colwellia sp. Arc7-635 TaxID=2497879 RepID=UPI000F85304A|nr:transporter substrate-binding domain-containing protein [Colwellia sp. Arc7-635]AZQ86015.1 transporter substrate-binding domain-containing protein [Colwellia sp. Arc7-635]
MSVIKTITLSTISLSLYLCCVVLSHAQEKPLLFLTEELPPYHFIDSQGEVAGAFVEIIQATLVQANLSGKIEIQPLARTFKATKNQSNTFMLSLLKTPNRVDDFQWVGQIYESYAVLVGLESRPEIELATLESAKPYMIGTVRGYHSEYFLRENGYVENENLSLSVTSKHLWAMLFNKRIDLVLTNYMALDRDIKKAGFDAANIKPYLSLPNFPNKLHIATGLTTPAVTVEKLSVALSEIKKSGLYQNILTKYNL